MRLLYYYWGEVTAGGVWKAMDAIGVQYKVVSPKRISYDNDVDFIVSFRNEILDENNQLIYDAVFSFNYFPDLSRIAHSCGIRYISWVYDSPHNTLESITLNNKCNRVYIFDYSLYLKYIEEGIDTVYYQPLPARIINKDVSEDFAQSYKPIAYQHNITFLGNFYDGDNDYFGKISYLPEYILGYLNALIGVQKQVYGADIFDLLINDEMMSEIAKYVKTELGNDYRKCGDEIFKNILRRRVTRDERIEVITRLGNEFGLVDLYCERAHPELPARYMGYAQYDDEMPKVFYSSKINLNISLRSIQTGIPLRIMDILGAGGFCITNYQAELEEYFENGVDLVWYESIDDLVEKCRYYLAHDEERETIARNGQKKVSVLFSYNRLLAEILKKIILNKY